MPYQVSHPCWPLLFLWGTTSTSRFWETLYQLNYFNGHLQPISLTKNAGLHAFLWQGQQGGDFTYINVIYQNFLLEAMIWQLRFSLCQTPITCYHYQPLLTKTLSKRSPARHWTMPFFCEAWLHTDGEPQLHNRFFSFLFFNLLLPDAPKNNAAQMDRVRDNQKFWTGTFANKQHFKPWGRWQKCYRPTILSVLYQGLLPSVTALYSE